MLQAKIQNDYITPVEKSTDKILEVISVFIKFIKFMNLFIKLIL